MGNKETSVTMVGQFPDGIDLHVRNLRWALPDSAIVVITTPSIISDFGLKCGNGVEYIAFDEEMSKAGFINFWQEFPNIIRKHDIRPDWFLFMEEDIWFYAHPVHGENRVIRSYLPFGNYRNVMVSGKLHHGRVWEGAQFISGELVRGAIDFGVRFSFVKETFLDRDREKFEGEFGGPVELSMYKLPDTMDEFGLYCGLVEKTRVEYLPGAVHMRGPESVHRLYPDIYRGGTTERLSEIQKALPYVDMMLVVAAYYIVGLWPSISHLDWKKLKPDSRKKLDSIKVTAAEWMTAEEYGRLILLLEMPR